VLPEEALDRGVIEAAPSEALNNEVRSEFGVGGEVPAVEAKMQVFV
jgi:hypothetical protein